jgi:two-component system chemotaxis response regulator CheB
MSKKIKVMIIDDSAVVRQTLTAVLTSDPKIGEVISANDPYHAVEKLKRFVPDVIILDIEMPRMDGLTFLQKLMAQHALPVIVCSTLSERGSEVAMKAFEYGAVEVIAKSKINTKSFLEEAGIVFLDKVKAAAQARIKKVKAKPEFLKPTPKLTADAVLPVKKNKAMLQTTEKVIVVGASTGGTEALRVFLEAMPLDVPGIVIVQHMPENFTAAFAKRLDSTCQITVREAKDNDTILRGQALIAPGNSHILLKRSGARYYVNVKGGPLVSRHRPSVDVLFRSAAQYAGRNSIGIIMTGMGDDGARGMLEMKEAGAKTAAQDEATSVVFGMPLKAIEIGPVDKILPLEKLAMAVYQPDFFN